MRHRPLLVWTAAFAAGVGLCAEGWLPAALAFGLAALGLALLALGRAPRLLAAGLALLGLAAGAVRLTAFQSVPASDVSHWADNPVPLTLTGTIRSDPEARRGGRLTFYLSADSVTVRRRTTPVTGDVSVALGPDAAHGPALDYGDRVSLGGTLETPQGATNPGAFSWRDYLARRAIYAELRVKRQGAVKSLGARRVSPVLALAVAVRRRVLDALQAALPPAQAALLGGMLIGHRTDLPPALLADFVRTGTVHVLASAGLHVGILAFWLEAALRRLTLPRKWQATLLVAALVLYALACGGRPAVTRAVVMAALYFGAVLFEREPDAPTAAGAAALLILMLQPTALLEPGFQLSFLTIGTLALAMPVWDGFWRPRIAARIARPWLRRAVQWLADMAGLSLLAQLGAAPIVAADYNEVSLSGWLANLIVVPALFLLLPLAFVGIGLFCLVHALGGPLLLTAGWGTTQIAAVVRAFAASPWAARAIPTPPAPILLSFYALVYGVTYAAREKSRNKPRRDAPPPAPAGPAAAPGPPALVGAGPPPGPGP